MQLLVRDIDLGAVGHANIAQRINNKQCFHSLLNAFYSIHELGINGLHVKKSIRYVAIIMV